MRLRLLGPIVCMAGLAATAAASDDQPHPYGQLPPEKVCELCYRLCEADCRTLACRMEVVSGWQRSQLAELKGEAERLRAIWYAAWWVTWKDARPAQRDEWADTLIRYIGQDAFWRGDLPLPLSAR